MPAPGLTVESATTFIDFGAFTAVNLSVIATAPRRRREGRASVLVGWYLVPLAGATFGG